MKPCLKTAAAREQKNAERGGGFLLRFITAVTENSQLPIMMTHAYAAFYSQLSLLTGKFRTILSIMDSVILALN